MSDQLEPIEGENLDGEGAGEGTAKPGEPGKEQPGKPAAPAPDEPIGAEELNEFESKPEPKKETKPTPEDTSEKDRADFQQAVGEGLKRVYKAGEGIDDKEERDKARLEAVKLEPEHVRGRLEKLVKGEDAFQAQPEKKGAKPQTQDDIDKMVTKANAKVKDAEEYKTVMPEILKAAKIDVKTADAKIKRTALALEAARLEDNHGHGRCDALRLAAATLGLISAEEVDRALKEGIKIGLKSQLPPGKPATAPKKDPETAGDFKQMSDGDIIAHGDKNEKG